jgi:hypothetical protein
VRSGTTRRSTGSRPPVRGGSLTTSAGRRAVRAVLGAAVAATVVVLSGCANPEYRFISSSERDVVVRVPWEWARLDEEDVRKLGQTPEEQEQPQETPEGSWSAYFDASPKPAPAHVIGRDLAQPVVLLQSAHLPEEAAASLTTDQLRDVYLPVSENARTQRDVAAAAQQQEAPKFRLISDTPVQTKTALGVHVVFAYTNETGREEIYDQVTVTDKKQTRWHVLFVHCSAVCYEARKAEIQEITSSFTVKAP